MKHMLVTEYLYANFVYVSFEDIRKVWLSSRLIKTHWFMWIWEISRTMILWLFSAEICSWVCNDFNLFHLYFDSLEHFTSFMHKIKLHFTYLMIELGWRNGYISLETFATNKLQLFINKQIILIFYISMTISLIATQYMNISD